MKRQEIINDDIDIKIIEETNQDIRNIEYDLITLSEIYKELSYMIDGQGDNLNRTNEDIATSIKNLADAEEITWKRQKIIRDLFIVLGGIGVGAFGFIAGPLIGLGTLLTGAGISGGIVYTSHKID